MPIEIAENVLEFLPEEQRPSLAAVINNKLKAAKGKSKGNENKGKGKGKEGTQASKGKVANSQDRIIHTCGAADHFKANCPVEKAKKNQGKQATQ